MSWDETSLVAACREAGFGKTESSIVEYKESRVIRAKDISGWMNLDADSGLTYGKLLRSQISEEEYFELFRILNERLSGKEFDWKTTVVFLTSMQ